MRRERQDGTELHGKILGMFFLQESTRTRVGFSAAAQRLGAGVVEVQGNRHAMLSSSPERDSDTLRIMSDYADVVAVRHHDPDFVRAAARWITRPLVNCGNGNDEHPTQALIDLFAIRCHFGCISGLTVRIAGDLRSMRVAHSLVGALKRYPSVHIELASPTHLRMPESYLTGDTGRGTSIAERATFDTREADVVYVAGYPRQRVSSVAKEKARLRYRLTTTQARHMRPSALILCPLPRFDEIAQDVDALPQAGYFQQSAAGLFVRMAVLKFLLKQPR
jgi:aspartate carbamoyltransferase catalytic subunit